MEIEDFKKKLKLERTTEEPIFSEPRIINCYKMRLHVYLNGYGTKKGKHLSILFQLMKGDFDDCLSWPFTKLVTLTVMHPENERADSASGFLDTDLESDPEIDDFESFMKPVDDDDDDNDEYQQCGYHTFISHKTLHSKGYIKEDRLFIKCEVQQ